MFSSMNRCAAVAGAAVSLCAVSANAANFGIDWLTMAPPAVGSSVPNGSIYNLAGVGNVTVTYSIPSGFSDARVQNPLFVTGNVTNGPDTYSWTDHEMFGATNLVSVDPIVPVQWRITFSFPGTVPAGQMYVGVAGLGQTTSFGGGATTATVNQNGTFLGDWSGGGNYGPTQYTPGAGTFSMQNSVTGAGGADPWWNSMLGVVRIDDPVSSITVDFAHISGDGAGVNIGFAVPTPGAMATLAGAGLLAIRRRRAA
jgi:hypothetical protein